MVEVGFDEKVRAQGRWAGRLGAPPAEALLPLGPAAVGDGGEFAGELHARVWRDGGGVVEAAAPVWVCHEDCGGIELISFVWAAVLRKRKEKKRGE